MAHPHPPDQYQSGSATRVPAVPGATGIRPAPNPVATARNPPRTHRFSRKRLTVRRPYRIFTTVCQ